MNDDQIIEQIARALSEHWRDMHTNESLGYERMLAAAVLPIVKAACAEAWDEGRDALALSIASLLALGDNGMRRSSTNPYTSRISDGGDQA